MKNIFVITSIICILLTSCATDYDIARRVSGTLTALPTSTNYPTYTNIPIISSKELTRTPRNIPNRPTVWKRIILMPDAENIFVNEYSCEEGNIKYQSDYIPSDVKAYYIEYMPKNNWMYESDVCKRPTCSKDEVWDHNLWFIKYEGGIEGFTYCASINIVKINNITNIEISKMLCNID